MDTLFLFITFVISHMLFIDSHGHVVTFQEGSAEQCVEIPKYKLSPTDAVKFVCRNPNGDSFFLATQDCMTLACIYMCVCVHDMRLSVVVSLRQSGCSRCVGKSSSCVMQLCGLDEVTMCPAAYFLVSSLSFSLDFVFVFRFVARLTSASRIFPTSVTHLSLSLDVHISIHYSIRLQPSPRRRGVTPRAASAAARDTTRA